MTRRSVVWLGSARKDVRAFPPAARRRAGHELDLIQQGLDATDAKPMPMVGDGVYEIRIRSEGAFRVFYAAKFVEGVVVLHAFQKKTQQTAPFDIQIGAQRYRQFVARRDNR